MTGNVPETMPKTMAAAGFDEPGGPDVLTLRDVPVPQARPGEVLIAVSHAGVNRPDVLQRQGAYPPPPDASPLPGLEVSGTIVRLGQGVDASRLGQRVCALVPGGGYAEYCTVPAGHCLPVPGTLTLAEAAAMPETLFTVWHNVFQRGQAKDGETLLVHGGTSGIGTMATMLGKLLGLTVIVTCGTRAKCEAACAAGADHAINYKTHDFVKEVERITNGAGIELVLDMVAGDYTARNIQCLKADGRLVTIAVLGGAKATVNMARVMTKRLTLTGSTLRPRSDAFKTALARDIAANVWPLAEQGRLRPVMDRTYALRDAADAHRRMEAGEHIGKIVLEVRA